MFFIRKSSVTKQDVSDESGHFATLGKVPFMFKVYVRVPDTGEILGDPNCFHSAFSVLQVGLFDFISFIFV